MKNLMKPILVLFSCVILISLLTNCSKDDDPTNNDFFAGTYTGSISYTDGDTSIENTNDGKVFVTKIASGTKYNFRFSNNIPNLNGVEFRKEGDNVLVSIDATTNIYIRIDDNVLKILYTQDGKTWTADCTR